MSTTPATTMYAELGGDAGGRALVDRFCDTMDGDPGTAPLRAMHAADLAPMRDKLADWMSAWLGGPPRYFERPDAACIGAAHGAFEIDAAMRGQWLECRYRALDESGATAALQLRIRKQLAELASILRNR